MGREVPATPTRRSKRFQPVVSVTPRFANLSGKSATYTWTDAAILERETSLVDLYDEETLENEDSRSTVFFEALTRTEAGTAKGRKGKGKKGRGQSDSATDTFRIGDTVLIDTPNIYPTVRKPSVAVIIAMWHIDWPKEDDDMEEDAHLQANMRIRVHWFLRPSELASVRARRDHLENEIYLSLDSTAILTPQHIISHCTVNSEPPPSTPSTSPSSSRASSPSPSENRSTKGSPKKSYKYVDDDANVGETFYCTHAVESRRGLYYDLDWEHHRMGALEFFRASSEDDDALDRALRGQVWRVIVKETGRRKSGGSQKAPAKGKRRTEPTSEGESSASSGDQYSRKSDSDGLTDPSEEEVEEAEEAGSDAEESDASDSGPKRKRGRGRPKATPSTPRKRQRGTLAAPTPRSKARSRARPKKALKVAAPSRIAGGDYAAHLAALPHDPWLRAQHVLHVAARPNELPCRDAEFARVLRAVEELLEEGSGGCVYISGVPGTGKTATVHAVVRELKRMAEDNETNPFSYVEINGLKIPEPAAAYGLLWEAVSGHDIREGHLKISTKEALKQLTKHFGMGGIKGGAPGGHACVVLMDELDQLVTTKQDVVYNFFNWPTLAGSKLVVIAVANTMDLPERVMTGRVRSRLGMIRINFQPYTTPQLETIVKTRLASANQSLHDDAAPDVISADGIKFAAMKVSSISGDARRVLDICRRTVELVGARRKTAGTADVKAVITVLQNSPTAAYLRACSLHERVMLAAVLKCVRREGVEEIRWGDVQHQHQAYVHTLVGEDESTRRPSGQELGMVRESLVAARAMLMEEGAAAMRKAEDERRVVLNLEQAEVERVLAEVGGQRWKNALSV